MAKNNQRSLIIGLDGATWTVLRPLIQSGELPTLQSLVSDGVSETLRSVNPPITAAAWFSFQTGMHPAQHGITSFRHITNKGRSSETVDWNTCTEPTIWEYLEANDLSTLSVNVPGTYPATDVPGNVISGILAPSYDDENAVSSREVRELVDSVDPDYQIFHNPRDRYDPHTRSEEFIEAMKQNVRSRAPVMCKMMDEYSWDVAMMQIQATDVLQHPMWKHIDSSHPNFEQAVNDSIVDFYKCVDNTVSEVIESARSDSSSLDIYVVSDHGFQNLDTKVFVDRMLEESDMLVSDNRSVLDWISSNILRLAMKLDRYRLRDYILSQDNRSSLSNTMHTATVDWDSSVAWGHGNFYGFVYLLDDSKSDLIISELQDTWGEEYVDSIVDLDQEFANVHPDSPDLIVVPKPGASMETLNDSSGPVFSSVDYDSDFHVGGHHPEGILIVSGSDVSASSLSRTPSLIDVMPTILHRHGIGVPENILGEPMCEVFDDDGTVETIPKLGVHRSEDESGTRDDVHQRLRDLGYTE